MTGGAAGARFASRAPLAAVVVTAAGAVVAGSLTVCPFAAITGLPCPGCGLLRATLALCDGDLGRAFALHPLAPAALVALGIAVARGLGRSRPTRPELVAAGLLLVALLGVWGARFAGALGGPVPVAAWLARAPR